MNRTETAALDQHPAVRDYVLVGMGALTVMVAALLLRRPDGWVMLPAFLGALALMFRWRAGPVIVLLAVLALLASWWLGTNLGSLAATVLVWLWRLLNGFWVPLRFRRFQPPERGALPVADVLLALSLLTYAAAHYRLQGLVGSLFPSDPRQKRAAARQGKAELNRFKASLRRSPELVTVREIVLLLAALAVCVGLAHLGWTWLRVRETELALPDPVWRGVLVLWLLGGSVLAAAGVLRYLALRRMTPPEAALLLQDVLWRETRREQRRLNRWLAWAWLRRRRREDKEQS
jgi:hypothetical protein